MASSSSHTLTLGALGRECKPVWIKYSDHLVMSAMGTEERSGNVWMDRRTDDYIILVVTITNAFQASVIAQKHSDRLLIFLIALFWY